MEKGLFAMQLSMDVIVQLFHAIGIVQSLEHDEMLPSMFGLD